MVPMVLDGVTSITSVISGTMYSTSNRQKSKKRRNEFGRFLQPGVLAGGDDIEQALAIYLYIAGDLAIDDMRPCEIILEAVGHQGNSWKFERTAHALDAMALLANREERFPSVIAGRPMPFQFVGDILGALAGVQ